MGRRTPILGPERRIRIGGCRKSVRVTNPQNREFIRPPRWREGRMRRRVWVGSVCGDFENPVDVDQVGVGQGSSVGLGIAFIEGEYLWPAEF